MNSMLVRNNRNPAKLVGMMAVVVIFGVLALVGLIGLLIAVVGVGLAVFTGGRSGAGIREGLILGVQGAQAGAIVELAQAHFGDRAMLAHRAGKPCVTHRSDAVRVAAVELQQGLTRAHVEKGGIGDLSG